MLAGALLGFLFGLPRVSITGRQHKSDAASASGLETNSNLDEVSDWLTKILVGLGLVQLGRISSAVSSLGTDLAPGLGGVAGAKGFAVGLLIYAAIDGFLIGYIWTRVDLSRIFQGAHESLGRPVIKEGIRAYDAVLQDIEQALAAPLPKVPKNPDEPGKQ
jgi:hypothetical protein